MYDILLNRLSTEGLTAVVSSQRVSYRDLTYVGIKYIKDGKFFRSSSYYTDTWLSYSPLGPAMDGDGMVICETFEDIAVVEQLPSLPALRQVRYTDEQDLTKLYQMLDKHADEFARKALSEFDSLIYKSNFRLVPVPQVLVTLAENKNFLGTISLNLRGGFDIVTMASPRIMDITSAARLKELPAMEVSFDG